MPVVLVVDDSGVDRKLVAGLLQKQPDWTARLAVNGREALDTLVPPLPDAIVTDLQMPEMNGLELVSAVKDDYPFIPVILLTAHGSEEIAAQALRRGAASYVAKHRIAADLISTVQRILQAAQDDRTSSRLMHHLSASSQTFLLRNDLELIRGIARHIQQQLRCLPLGDEIERLRVSLAVEEALKNAAVHGNLETGSTTRQLAADELAKLIQQRSMDGKFARRRIHLEMRVDRDRAEFVIRDEGPGFDHAALEMAGALSNQDETSSRGLWLIRTIMDEVRFNDAGNELTLIKRALSVEDLVGDDSDD